MFGYRTIAKTSHSHLELGIESLERREMLAGNVAVNLVFDVLSISGDSKSNVVDVVSDGSTITLIGRGTKFNDGATQLSFDASTVGSIEARLFGGNDRLNMIAENESGTAFSLTSLLIDTDTGNDRVTLLADNADDIGFFVSGSTSILTGAGNDRVKITTQNQGDQLGGLQVGFLGGTLLVNTGSNNDVVEMIAANTVGDGVRMNQDLLVDAGDGNDRIVMTAKNEDGTGVADTGFSGVNFTVSGSDGNDRISLLAQNSGDAGFSFGRTILRGLEGNDRVELIARNSAGRGFEFFDITTIATDAGNDRVTVSSERPDGIVLQNQMFIDTNEGNDRVDVRSTDFGMSSLGGLRIRAGDGNDFVRTRGTGVDFVGAYVFDGGDGRDRLFQLATLEGGDLFTSEFEIERV